MGWASGRVNGREVGYSVQATCDLKDCDAKIDRGLYYVCGSMHGGGEHGCGGYFCSSHMFYSHAPEQLCQDCLDLYEKDYPDPEEEV